MQNLTFSQAYSFREFKFMDTHHIDLPYGLKFNCIGYVIKGQLEIVMENQRLHFEEGDVYLIPKGKKYRSRWRGNPEISFKVYSYLNYPGEKVEIAKLQKFKATPKILELIDKIPTDNVINCYSVARFYLLLDELLKGVETTTLSKEELLLNKAMNYMRENPDCLIPKVASHCNISESGFYNLFKKYSKMTPTQYRVGAKLDKAFNLIVSTDIPIEQISDICGFSSSSYFRKHFIKKYKKTPSKIRKESLI